MQRVIAVAAFALSLPVCDAAAQTSTAPPATDLTTSSRVRVTTHAWLGKRQTVGAFVSIDADSLRMVPQGSRTSVAFPVGNVLKLEASEGRHHRVLRSMGIGILAGAGAGAILGAATYTPCESDEMFGCILAPVSRGESATIGAAVFGAVGLLTGTIVGLAVPSERWHAVDPARAQTITIAPAGGGVRIGARVPF